jgi:D-alanyl-D-alanine carboxypeptidase
MSNVNNVRDLKKWACRVMCGSAFLFASIVDVAASEVVTHQFEIELDLESVVPHSFGADPAAPWLVHMSSVNLRDAPTVVGSKIVGVAKKGEMLSGDYLIVQQSDQEWLRFDYAGADAYVSRMALSRVHPHNLELINKYGNLPYGEPIVDRWWGIPIDYVADDLEPIPSELTLSPTREYLLRKEANASLAEMFAAMKADGLSVYVSSSYRSGKLQQSMFVRAMAKNLGQRGTAPPGHSEHQLGSTVDITLSRKVRRALRNADAEYQWLAENGARYGWIQTYRGDNIEQTGYIEEPWHWTYIGK